MDRGCSFLKLSPANNINADQTIMGANEDMRGRVREWRFDKRSSGCAGLTGALLVE